MTTSKILVPAGTNLDGTKDRVPVDIEIPQPLHVVIDGDGSGGGSEETMISIVFDDIVSYGSFDVYSAILGVFDDPQDEESSIGFSVSVNRESPKMETFSAYLPLKNFCQFRALIVNMAAQNPSISFPAVTLTFVDSQTQAIVGSEIEVAAVWRERGDEGEWSLSVDADFSSVDVPQDAMAILATLTISDAQ